MTKKINPKWSKAEASRLLAEEEYTTLRTKWESDVQKANAKIEKANQAVRDAGPQYLEK